MNETSDFETIDSPTRQFKEFLRFNDHRVNLVAGKLAEFKVDGATIGIPKAKDLIEKWLGNFSIFGLSELELPLRLIEAIELIPTETIVNKLVLKSKDLLSAHPFITHLGEVSESSYRITAQLNSQPNFYPNIETLLDAAPRQGEYTLCFYDDFLNSGGQVVTIFKALLNIPLEKNEVDDEWNARTKLNDRRIEVLKRAHIHIYYYKAFDEGIDHFEAQLAKLGLKVKVHRFAGTNNNHGAFGDDEDQKRIVHKAAGRLVTDCTFINRPYSELTEFYKLLQGIGEALLRLNELKWEDWKYSDRSLGYGNKCRVICTDHNIPTVSFTALWSSGEISYQGITATWNLLIPRRKKELGKAQLINDSSLGMVLMQEVIVETKNFQENMLSPVHNTIRTYLSLSDPHKIDVAKSIGVYSDEILGWTPTARDKEIMKRVSQTNRLKELWDAVNAIKRFPIQINPFNN